MRPGIPLLLLAFFFVPGATLAEDPCPRPMPEYCSAGCDDLQGWIVEDFESFEQAYAVLMTLDEVERVSAFIVQAPMAHLMIRRERASKPAAPADMTKPYWRLQEYGHPLEAAADAHAFGGFIYATNGGGAEYVRVWQVYCPDESGRGRVVGRE